mgnify:CR=1 FL=1
MIEPKYIKEVNQLLDTICEKLDIEGVENDELIILLLSTTGLTKQKLSDDLVDGVKKGYSVEFQVELLTNFITKAIKGE